MKKLDIILKVFEYQSINELDEQDQVLVHQAIEAASDAYAPYSNFHVGAAVLLDNGVIIKGNNQENAAYPSGLCAERVALFAANAQYPDVPVVAMAIVAMKDGQLTDTAVTPCGACRQVMIETEVRFEHPIKVILYGKENILVVDSVRELLPLSFTSTKLKP